MPTLRPALILAAALLSNAAFARDPRPGEPGYVDVTPTMKIQAAGHIGSSPFNPPEANDTTFVVDSGPGLDTGCAYRSGGPLVFEIPADRAFEGPQDIQKLKQNGLISPTATLRLPAYDIDFDSSGPDYAPERDRVSFNGRVVPEEFLTGGDSIWKLNAFQVPIEWVNFRASGDSAPGRNVVQIDIDTANSDEIWCTAIDWASLSFQSVRPVVFAHGILSEASVWENIWVPKLRELGVPASSDINPNMGNLDSIQDNAGEIAAAVEKAKDRWGVDKVNLVTHSKGGLDSRQYVETADTVETVVMLGTPNAGSPLADLVQAALVAVSPSGSIVVNALAGAAGVQLTRPYMALYNSNHDYNDKVSYNALAGQYDPQCFFCITKVLTWIVGPGDTIVPVSSVHSLPYTRNFQFGSAGADKDSTHTQLEHSLPIFQIMSPTVVVLSQEKAAAAQTEESQHSATAGGRISAGQVQTQTVIVDQAPAMISLLYQAGDLDLVLVSPSGRRIDPAVAAADADIEFAKGDITGGKQAAYLLEAAEPGIWEAEIRVASGASIDYAVNAWPGAPTAIAAALSAAADSAASTVSGVTLDGGFSRQSIAAGEDLVLQATVREQGVPVLDATARARIGLPDSSHVDIVLRDDGLDGDETASDGIYSATHRQAALPGLYRTVFVAEGINSAGHRFSREVFGLATVSHGRSHFTAFRDVVRDTNGNGYYDELVVEADVEATVAGRHHALAVLTDSAGHAHWASAYQSLSVGANTISLVFSGKDIYRDRTDGPYVLSSVKLAQENGVDLLPTDARFDAHATGAYGFAQFEHERITLTGTGFALGVDENSNGLYDLLDVAIDADVAQAGQYRWTAQLSDRTGAKLGFFAGAGYFNAGQNSLLFSFDGEPIGKNGEDGPYYVTDLLVYGGNDSLVAEQVFTAEPFRADQFEGYVRDTIPPVLTLSADPSQLWPPNHRMVPVHVDVHVQDDLDPQPVVTLVSVISNEADNGLGDGDLANDIQDAALGMDDRDLMVRAERSGTGAGRVYELTYQARDAAGNTSTSTVKVSVLHSRN